MTTEKEESVNSLSRDSYMVNKVDTGCLWKLILNVDVDDDDNDDVHLRLRCALADSTFSQPMDSYLC